MGTSKYNLEQLGWYNFEQLVRTLFRELLGSGLSTFSGSVDQGRDATFIGKANAFPSKEEPWDKYWIIQVKHRTYSSQGADTTRKEIKRLLPTEIEKIFIKHGFCCDNYIFVTNCPLTANDKDEMAKSISSSSDSLKNSCVLAESDLDELLDLYPNVVSAFPQILGLSQLQKLIQWGLHQRSLKFLSSAQNEISTFVATTSYLKALDLLHKQHFCVLSGPPKMGKTCTAYALAASFSALSFEVWDLRSQRDFYDAYSTDAKQLFICDDVFGDISMHSTMRDEWARGLMRLLGSLGRKHKLVWTAREYILREALSSSKLKEERASLATTDKVTVAVDELSRIERAMILYNHARIAKLQHNVREFLKTKACINIVDHENYSPESIRQLCTGRLLSFIDETPDNTDLIYQKVSDFLSRPGDAWKTAYLNAPDGEKLLCSEVMASGGSITVKELRKRYENSIISLPNVRESFDASFTNAIGTFLRKWESYNHDFDTVKFYHPSMRDLLAELIEEDKSIRLAYLKQLTLKEVPTLVKPYKSISKIASSEHRILIEDIEDIELLKDHLKTTLLPNSTVIEVLNVLNDLLSAIGESVCRTKGNALRKSVDYPKVLWMILDSVVPHGCSQAFWAINAAHSYIHHWRIFFEILRSLLPLTDIPAIPLYVNELLRRNKNELDTEYWGLVEAAHSIVPTIVEQYVNRDNREICRLHLANQVEEAISESEEHDLEYSFDDSQSWHDKFGEIPKKCEDYVSLFPNDKVIARVDELSEIIQEFPRKEQDPDEDYTPPSSHNSSKNDSEILDIFSDL